MSDQTPQRIGDYEVLDVLGAGGMGRVYRVRNIITDRIEAMKVLLPDLQGHEEVAARFLREIKVLAALNHPNIAVLHTALTIDNQLVMIMEYVEGQTISARLNQGAIPAAEALNYIEQVLNALSYAHKQHIIHRDIKPANMMLTPDGTVKLMDFGIARTDNEPNHLTAPGSTLGSINYMSPEQVKGEPIDERSDLYSVGISLYEMVTGQKPFHGDSNFSIMSAHLQQTPTPPVQLHPGLPDELNALILTSIAKAPDQRFQSADAFRYAIGRVNLILQESKTMVAGSHDFTTPAPSPMSYRPTASLTAAGKTTAPHVVPQTTSPVAVPPVNATVPVTQQPISITPPPTKSAGNRGLYIALGAVIVLVALVAAGIYLPGRGKSSVAANSEQGSTNSASASMPTPQASTPVVTQQAPPPQSAPAESAQPPAETAASTPPPATPTVPAEASTPRAAAKKLMAKNVPPQQLPPPPAENAQAQPAASSAQLDEIEHQIDQLHTRAGSVNASLERMQREQGAAGYGLRGDIVTRWTSMKLNLSKAQNAIEHNDAGRAKRYADAADSDMSALESFLGH
ncbi:MAG TPA: protein kinase [Terriglobales bacterium]|nr:protein kinase [Terriglobales bacterium]